MELEPESFDTVCVVGSGFMGSQIGLHCAVYGDAVWLVDPAREALERAAQSHARELERRLGQDGITVLDKEAILSRIHLTTDLSEGVGDADLVIEAVPEQLDLKRSVFAQLDQATPERTILATGSSSIRASAIERATNRPDRVLNMHLYTPVWQRTIVELMGGTSTSAETMDKARAFALSVGLTPLLVRKESTGFIFNRVWRAIKKECLDLVDEGVASHEDVDRAWMINIGMSIGPFGLMDMVGLDVVRGVEMVYYQESDDEADRPPRLLPDKPERGDWGSRRARASTTIRVLPSPSQTGYEALAATEAR